MGRSGRYSKFSRDPAASLTPSAASGSQYIRTFTFEELGRCFAPPLGEVSPPSHWPRGWRVSQHPRVAWLPPGWGQAEKEGKGGSKRTFWVAPEHLGSKICSDKAKVERIIGKKVEAVDEHGVVLGEDYIKKWPRWLPKDFLIAYFRSPQGSIKHCFLGPTGLRYNDKGAVLARNEKDLSRRYRFQFRTLFGERRRKQKGRTTTGKLEAAPPCFRTFGPLDLLMCFRPPLEEIRRPAHWPKTLIVCDSPRTSWLPQGWAQAWKEKPGRKRKLYVSPQEKGTKVAYTKGEVEAVEGRKLFPMDEHGVCLGEECVTKWPKWLPRDWQIGYYKALSGVKVCFVNPDGDRYRDCKAVLGSLDPNKKDAAEKQQSKEKQRPGRSPLGPFALSMSRRHRQMRSKGLTGIDDVVKGQEEEEDPNSDVFRSFSYQELMDCFAPPLWDSTTPPPHWPEDLPLQVSTCPRVPWLPPGWGQAFFVSPRGREYRVYVAPEAYGRKLVKNKESMEVLLGRKLRPLDQYGKPLGVGSDCICNWPPWLPKDWRIAYYKAEGEVKTCFFSPDDIRCNHESEVKARLQMDKVVEKRKQGAEEHLKKRKRLRRADVEDVNSEAADVETVAVKEEDATSAVTSQTSTRSAREQSEKSRVRRPRLRLPTEGRSGLDLAALSEADLCWLVNHPLYKQIHERGYPIPIGDQDILALKAFTPTEMGGDGSFCFF